MRNFFVVAMVVASWMGALACTSAIIAGSMTKNGRPLLWKHRDTSDFNNKVEKIEASDGRYEYVALYNSSDSLCREAWIGFNSEGFAVMNTASYNLKADTVTQMDREGLLMSEALATCRTVGDFEQLLTDLPKPLGVEANFGVIDAQGGAAYFETCNYGYRRCDVDGYMVRTNYSHSGRKDEGYGYIREQNAEALLVPYIEQRMVEPSTLTEVLSRSFYHSLMGKDMMKGNHWVVDKDFIPRYSSSASVVIEGVNPGEPVDDATMWTVLGYPPCGVVEPVWLWSIPDDLRANPATGKAPACDRANLLKAKAFPITRDRGEGYIDADALRVINKQCRKESLARYKAGYAELEQHRKEAQR